MMKNSPTIVWVLRDQGLEFIAGIILIGAGAFGLFVFEPDPPTQAFSSLMGMLGIWPYLIFMAMGAFYAGRAWHRSSALRNGS